MSKLQTIVDRALEKWHRAKNERIDVRVPVEAFFAIAATKVCADEWGKSTGNTEPTDDELRELWGILKRVVGG